MAPRHAARGFTLVEVLAVCAIAGVLAGVALPGYHSRVVKAHRFDAVAALGRLQAAQEQMRSAQGAYSADLGALRVAPHSAEGLYTLAVELTAADAYRATATPREPDADCPRLELTVRAGFAQAGPSAACWNRR